MMEELKSTLVVKFHGLWLFAKQINRFVKQKTNQFLNDLSKVE